MINKLYDNEGRIIESFNESMIVAINKPFQNTLSNFDFNRSGVTKNIFLSNVKFRKNEEIFEIYYSSKDYEKFQTKRYFFISEIKSLDIFLEENYENKILVTSGGDNRESILLFKNEKQFVRNKIKNDRVTILKEMGTIIIHSNLKNYEGIPRFTFEIEDRV